MQKDSIWRGERMLRKDEGFSSDSLAVKKDPIDFRLQDQVV